MLEIEKLTASYVDKEVEPKEVEPKEVSQIADGDVNWWNHFGRHLAVSFKTSRMLFFCLFWFVRCQGKYLQNRWNRLGQ